jgi:uncharacterized membrane protein
MLTVKFRQVLRQEVDRWRAEGLIDSNLHGSLAERYQFEKLEAESSGAFVSALIGLGAVLIGLGILSFVAANWQYLDKPFRIAVLLGTLLVVNIGGFYLWQRSQHNRRLAEGVLLLGGLVLGANMALLAQLFHVFGETFILFMGWSLGVTIMAYALRMTSLGAMAIALMGWGYWSAAFDLSGRAIAPLWAQWLVDYMPICALGLFLPLAYRCRSSIIFLLTAIAWLSSYQFEGITHRFGINTIDRWGVLLICGLPPLLLWVYGRIQGYLAKSTYTQQIAQFSQRLAVISGVFTCFLLSFDGFIANALLRGTSGQIIDNWWSVTGLFLPLTIGLWIWLGKMAGRWQSSDLLVGGWGVAITGLLAIATNASSTGGVIAGAFFLLLAVATALGIQSSLQTGDRGVFYFNWSILAIRIFSWFAFMQVDLGLKSLLFVLCGVATVAIGVWFEKRMRRGRLVSNK